MRRILLIYSVLFFVFTSCIKEKFDPNKVAGLSNFTSGIAIPIGFAHMTLQRYFNDSTSNKGVIIDNNGFITLVYREKVFSIYATDFIKIPDISDSFIINQPGPQPIKGIKALNSDTVSYTEYFQILPQTSGVHINSIDLSSGQLTILISNPLSVTGIYSINFPGIIINGSPLVVNGIIKNGNDAKVLDISQALVKLSSKSDSDNFLLANFSIIPSSLGNSAAGKELLSVDFNLHNIQYSVLYGYVEAESIPITSGSFPLSFYDILLHGNFYFADPKLKLLFTNSMGLPTEVYFKLIGVNTKKIGPTFIAGIGVPGSGNPKLIHYPTIPGDTAQDEILLDSTNSNLRMVMSSIPTSINFDVMDTINPGTNDKSGFMTDSSRLEASLQLELPLQGRTDSSLLIQDTLKFAFSSISYKSPSEISFLIFRIYAKNGFPVEMNPQIYFTDDRLVPLDSLIAPNAIIKSAGIDANGIVNNATSTTIDVKLEGNRIQNIEKATHIITRGRITSSNFPKYVKFLNKSIYALDFDLGVIIQLNVNTGL